MRNLNALLAAMLVFGPLGGCRDNTPPVPRVPPPAPGQDVRGQDYEGVKPMPAPGAITSHPQPGLSAAPAPQPFDDEPLLVDQPPEAKAFVDYYNKVGRPRMLVWVNRVMEGSPDQQEARSRAIDYGMMELLLTDWLSCDNAVQMLAPSAARRKLAPQQVDALEGGRMQMADIAQLLDCDILIHVQARPTRQYQTGTEMRIIAEAMNTRGGDSIARAAVDMSLPMDKPQMNKFTRFMARKLMDGMIRSWTNPVPDKPTDVAPSPAPAGGQGSPR